MSDATFGYKEPERTTEQTSGRAFLYILALVFAISTVVTVVWCSSMPDMGGMAMPGGWTMSMTWMLMPGQTWSVAAAAFLGMWDVMMVAMMLPSLAPMMWRYRQAVGSITGPSGPRLGLLTALVAVGYFLVWTVVGIAVYPLGIALAEIVMRYPTLSHAVPMASAVVVLIAGALQFTAWKARRLDCCSDARCLGRGGKLSADASSAWRHGLRLGLQCNYCCAGMTVVLLVIGVMDLRTMAVVTVAITAERLAPAGRQVARAIGAVLVGAGLLLIARACLLG